MVTLVIEKVGNGVSVDFWSNGEDQVFENIISLHDITEIYLPSPNQNGSFDRAESYSINWIVDHGRELRSGIGEVKSTKRSEITLRRIAEYFKIFNQKRRNPSPDSCYTVFFGLSGNYLFDRN